MGVVVRRYIDILIIFPTPLVLALFRQQHPSFFVHVFSFLFMLFCAIYIANVAQRKSRSRGYGDIINYIDRNVECILNVDCARARVPRLPRARYRVTF